MSSMYNCRFFPEASFVFDECAHYNLDGWIIGLHIDILFICFPWVCALKHVKVSIFHESISTSTYCRKEILLTKTYGYLQEEANT